VRVLFIFNGLTHYYNLVLSRLNREPEVELTVVAPAMKGGHVGEGVYQTRDGVDFQVVELEEARKLGLFSTFKGLAGVLRRERPDVVIVPGCYLRAFLFDGSLRRTMKKLRCKLILKSIPFRLLSYPDARRAIGRDAVGFSRLPSWVNRLLLQTGVARLVRHSFLAVTRRAFCLPDAHVNYVDAHEIWTSYGVDREKIFVTRNSPDTDLLFSARESLADVPSILPHNPHRLLHVGRLVAWKRVDMLVRALSRSRQRFPNAELLVIGTGPEEAALKELVQKLHLDAAVTFLGGVYDPQLLGQYYLASSLYVLAGMGGLSINEAMCFGRPILCSVCDGTEKVLVREGINGRYFRDGDEDDLLEKIIWFFDHPGQALEMGRRSVEIIRNEVNIHTVIEGYMDALHYVTRQRA
jgi:glycosyltransferase involved in cell wall biosynthesis